MSTNNEIISQKEYEELVKKQIEISKRELEKAFEKLEDENINRKTKTNSDRGKNIR